MNKETQDAQSTSSDSSLKVNINKGSKHAQPAADTSHPASPKPATSDPATATRSRATLTRPQRISYTRAQADAPKKNSPASDQTTSIAKPSTKPHQAPKASVFDYRPLKSHATSVKTTNSQTSSTQASGTKSSRKRHSDKKTFNKQTITMITCAALAICLTVLVTWGIISILNRNEIKEETTFATNDNQTTITIEPSGDDSGSISHTRTVYEYDGDNVVGMKTYFEYADNETAKRAYEFVKDQPEFKGAEVIDKYIVVTADPNQFKGLTADDIRQQAEAIERFQKSRKKTTPQSETAENQEEHPAENTDDSSSPDES